MKKSEAIKQADQLRPNTVPGELKERWLWMFEAEVADLMGKPVPEHDVYPKDSEEEEEEEENDPELLLPDPHSNIYPLWLLPYIDFAQEEFDLYQADIMMANVTWDDIKRQWGSNHKSDNATIITGVFY